MSAIGIGAPVVPAWKQIDGPYMTGAGSGDRVTEHGGGPPAPAAYLDDIAINTRGHHREHVKRKQLVCRRPARDILDDARNTRRDRLRSSARISSGHQVLRR